MQSTCEKNGLFFCVYLLVQVSLAARFPYMVSIDSDEKNKRKCIYGQSGLKILIFYVWKNDLKLLLSKKVRNTFSTPFVFSSVLFLMERRIKLAFGCACK